MQSLNLNLDQKSEREIHTRDEKERAKWWQRFVLLGPNLGKTPQNPSSRKRRCCTMQRFTFSWKFFCLATKVTNALACFLLLLFFPRHSFFCTKVCHGLICKELDKSLCAFCHFNSQFHVLNTIARLNPLASLMLRKIRTDFPRDTSLFKRLFNGGKKKPLLGKLNL